MKISDIDILDNYKIIEPLLMKDVGIERLKKFVSWPFGVIPEDWKTTFDVLTEFVVFNECFKIPFYVAFRKAIGGKLENLYKPLFNMNPSVSDNRLSIDEAFSLLSTLGVDQAEKLIRMYGGNNVNTASLISAIKNNDKTLFIRELSYASHFGWMNFLWKIRFYTYGLQHMPEENRSTKKQIPIIDMYDIGLPNIWDIRINYSDFMAKFIKSDEVLKDRLILFMEAEFYSRELKTLNFCPIDDPTLTCDYLILNESDYKQVKVHNEFYQLLFGEHKIDGSYYPNWKNLFPQKYACQDKFAIWFKSVDISSLKEKCEKYLAVATYGLLEKNIVNVNNEYNTKYPEDIETLSRRRLKISYLGKLEPLNEDQISTIGEYIFYITYLTQIVYERLKSIISDEERTIFKWLLETSVYSDAITSLDTKASLNKDENAVCEEVNNFQLKEPLTKKEFEILYNSLLEGGFINSETRKEDFQHVLGGPKPDKYAPVDWIKKTTKKQLSKKSVLNLLRLLGVEWEFFTPIRLNYCFKVGKSKFTNANLKDNKNSNGKDYGINALSDRNEELEKIMSEVFKENCGRLEQIKSIKLIQKTA